MLNYLEMYKIRMFDISVYINHDNFNGIYRGELVHKPDFDQVYERARENGVHKMIFIA